MIELRSVTKCFGSTVAVRDVSLDVPAGSVVGVLGPNGAGKTTTIRMVCGLIPPTSGRIRVAGHDTVAEGRAARHLIGYLPEASPLPAEMRVDSYLRYRGALFGLHGSRARAAIDRVIDRCDLGAARRRRIGTLSKGYRQRVGLAAALLHEPRVLILDEPTSGLDPAQIAETRSLIRDLAGDRTALIVSHLLPEVRATCDRLVVFAHGEIRADGAPGELARTVAGGHRIVTETRAADEPMVAEAIDAAQLADLSAPESTGDGWVRRTLGASGSDQEQIDAREALARALAARRVIARELRRDEPSLESLYLGIVDRPAVEGDRA
ncbi:MAG: ABC transporter ATP-binding protein [Planctomycetota bacterium]